MPWLYSGVTKTCPSNALILAAQVLVCSLEYCPMAGGAGSSSKGRLESLTSTSSNSASVRRFVSSYTHLATDSPTRPGRVLPMMTAILSMSHFPECKVWLASSRWNPHKAILVPNWRGGTSPGGGSRLNDRLDASAAFAVCCRERCRKGHERPVARCPEPPATTA